MTEMLGEVRGRWVGVLLTLFWVSSASQDVVCRERYGPLALPVFKLWSCTMCYSYLFREDEMELKADLRGAQLVAGNESSYPRGRSFSPDIENNTVVEEVCHTMEHVHCERWTACCRAALDCCWHQNALPPPDSDSDICPRTWDGFGCFDDTRAGDRSFIKCPSYIEHSNPRATAYKDCTLNATWYRDPETNTEWTNYTTCVGMDV